MFEKDKPSLGYIHFLDDWELLSRQNLERKLGKPKYVEEATLEDVYCEGTWDFPCVAWVEEKKKYIGLYGAAVPLPDDHELIIMFKKKNITHLKPRNEILCYAESDDGINWVKPDLSDIVMLKGKRWCQNQVTEVFEGGPAFYDLNDKDASRRFKIIINYMVKENETGMIGGECRAMMVSPDGINWKQAEIFRDISASDAPTCLYYDDVSKMYYISGRKYTGDRRVFIWKTKDFITFSQPELVMHPQPMDPPLVGFYGMPVFKYENIFIGLLWIIYNDPANKQLPNGAIDVSLAYSYNGSHFNRAYFKPFIERNELGEHGGGCVYTGSMLVDKDNLIRFYSGGSKAEHFQNQELTDAALILHTLRLDGFCYLSTPTGKGNLRTRWFRIKGDDLRINVRCPWGSIRVQILDEEGKPLNGFSYDDCIPFTGDSLFWHPEWKKKKFIDAKSNKRRQLELEITTGEIYAIRGDFEMLKTHWEKDLDD
ncbi:MAG: hypothetical protein JXQ23_07940 [Clostridia bacterium]|nr:hypothetical protein [Clostridia bacterium]